VRYLSAIVEVSALAVLDARQDLALGGGVALELVRHDHPQIVPRQLIRLIGDADRARARRAFDAMILNPAVDSRRGGNLRPDLQP